MWIWIPIAGIDSNLGNTVEHHRNVTNSTFLIMRKWWYNWYNNVKHEILSYRTSDCWRRSASFFFYILWRPNARSSSEAAKRKGEMWVASWILHRYHEQKAIDARRRTCSYSSHYILAYSTKISYGKKSDLSIGICGISNSVVSIVHTISSRCQLQNIFFSTIPHWSDRHQLRNHE